MEWPQDVGTARADIFSRIQVPPSAGRLYTLSKR